MTNSEMVIVPRSDLDKIEEARLALHKMFENTKDIATIMAITNITQPMWQVSHKKYPIYDIKEEK